MEAARFSGFSLNNPLRGLFSRGQMGKKDPLKRTDS